MEESTPSNVTKTDLQTQKPSASAITSSALTNKTQAITTPKESLSPHEAQSPAQSENITPTPTTLKQKQANLLTQNANWLQTASERIEKTIELINIKKIKEALQILLELDSVFESAGIYISTDEDGKSGFESTKPESPTPGQTRNKSAFQLAIITKYNLACCFQSLGESQKCIKYLQSASKQLNYYSNNMNNNKGLFKVTATGGNTNQNTNRVNTNAQSLEKESPNSAVDTNVDFNEYNCMGMTPKKDEKQEELKQTHEQLSAQLQANRYLCKFHLQLCAILSQMGQHTSANENGQRAAAIAEIILIKTHEFCQSSVEDILMKDGKQKSLLDQNVPESHEVTTKEAKEDYTNSTLQSKMTQQKQGEKRGMTRGSSVTSLYSMEKERKSVSIRRSKSRGQTGRGRESSAAADSEDSTHKSLERMYTFNLSKTTKAARLKSKKDKAAKGDGADTPAMVRTTSPRKGLAAELPNLSNLADQKEDKKGEQQQQDVKQSEEQKKRSNSNNFCPTYQVLERTNIQEKQLLNIQPLLNEFNRIAGEFSRKIGFEDLTTTHEQIPSFASIKEITSLKTNKRFKINVRNALGVKDHNNWIYNLNIGNVMNLTPMNSDELNSQPDVFQELSKDTMLEKIILYVVAYFCVGTEIRFQATKLEKKESPQEYFKVWSSEMWHGKSLQTACLFLPEDCPLVDHIIKSYKKHYIGKTSLLSVVIQPKPKVPPATITEQTVSPETSKMLKMFEQRSSSQQQINNANGQPPRSSTAKDHETRVKSPLIHQPNNEPNQQKEVHETIKTVSCISSNANVTPANEDASSEVPLSLQKANQKMQRGSIKSSDQSHNINSSIGAQTNPVMLNENSINQASLIHNMNSVTQLIGRSSQEQAFVPNNGLTTSLKATQNLSKAKNLKRQMTLKELAMRSTMKHVENIGLTVPIAQAYSKEPPKSPEEVTSPLETAAQSESVSCANKSVGKNNRKSLKKNYKYPSATAIGLGGMDEPESRNLVRHEKKLATENVQNKSPSVRNRGLKHPISPQARHKSPKELKQEQRELQAAHQRELQKQHQLMQETDIQPSYKTITYNDIQRLQHNLNMQVQQKQLHPLQNQQNEFNDDMLEDERIGSLIERPISAQNQHQFNTEQHTNPSASQKNLKSRKGKDGSFNTPKRHSAIGRKRQQPSVSNSIQKLVQKPNSKHSKVLSMNMQAWSSSNHGGLSAHTNSSKPSKQKVMMLKQKSNLQINSPHQTTTQASYLPSGAQTATATAQQSLWLGDKTDSKKQEIHAKFENNQIIVFKQKLATNTARATMQAQMSQNTMQSPVQQHSVSDYNPTQKPRKNFDEMILDLRAKEKRRNTDNQQQQNSQDQYLNLEPSSISLTGTAAYPKKDGKASFQSGMMNLTNQLQHSVTSNNTQPSSTGTGKPRLQSSKQKTNAQQMAIFHPQKGVGPLTQTYNATTGQHTLKKSSSTSHVVNLLDIQTMRPPQTQHQAHHPQSKGQPNFSQTQTLQPPNPQIGQQQQISNLMQQLSAATGIPAYAPQGYKHLTKKTKNTKSTGMLHHYN